MNPGPVIMIGLDAFDPEIALGLAAAGELPTLAGLLESGARCPINNPYGLMVGALWVSFATALKPARHGYYCWEEVDIDTYRVQPNPIPDGGYVYFWQQLAQAGLKVAAIDVPHARAVPPINGVHIAEWGAHDRHFGLHSAPVERAGNLANAFGFHPVLGVEPFAKREFASDDAFARSGMLRTAEEEKVFAHALRKGVAMRGKMLEELMAEQDWDLFLAVFGESHASGHQQWHLHDAKHPRFDRDVQQAVGGDPLLHVYRDIDAAVGRLLAQAPSDATIMVHLSHGMGPHYDGIHLLDEILARLEAHYRGGDSPDDPRNVAKRLLTRLKPGLRRIAELARVSSRLRSAVARRMRGDLPEMRAKRAFFSEPNNFVYGGVRLNLKGREPNGVVDPADADALCDRLAADLLAITNPDTGRPIIASVERCDRHHARSPGDRMPDLFLCWERHSPIEAARSPKIGTIRDPYVGWRTGDHKPDGLLVARGPGIAPGAEFPAIDVEDLGPSAAALLGVQLEDIDGCAAAWLVSGQ